MIGALIVIALLAVAVGAFLLGASTGKKAKEELKQIRKQIEVLQADTKIVEEAKNEKDEVATIPDSGLADRANALFVQNQPLDPP